MRFLTMSLLMGLAISTALTSHAQNAGSQTPCDVHFDPTTVKPGILESVKTVIFSFQRKGEAERLTHLKNVVFALSSKKKDLIGALEPVLQSNSVQNWMVARLTKIPELQRDITNLLKEMRAEADEGGLFAGDKAFEDLTEIINDKSVELRELCQLSNHTLPLDYQNRSVLDHYIQGLRAEVATLQQIDDELGALIDKANGAEKKKTESQSAKKES
jgi:hypothetical protein